MNTTRPIFYSVIYIKSLREICENLTNIIKIKFFLKKVLTCGLKCDIIYTKIRTQVDETNQSKERSI